MYFLCSCKYRRPEESSNKCLISFQNIRLWIFLSFVENMRFHKYQPSVTYNTYVHKSRYNFLLSFDFHRFK